MRRPLDPKPDAKLDQLDRDPTLLAHYPLDGDFKDALGHGDDLTPVSAGQHFSPDTQVPPGSKRVFGPTQAGRGNGATAGGIPADAAGGGYTMCGWFKRTERRFPWDAVRLRQRRVGQAANAGHGRLGSPFLQRGQHQPSHAARPHQRQRLAPRGVGGRAGV